MNGFLEALANEEPGYSVTICMPGYTKTEFDKKKVVEDGSIVDLKLLIDESKYQSVDKAASLVIKGIEKKKVLYHLTNQGGIGAKLNQVFPVKFFINSKSLI
jgi:short-subunit dehydrogenase